ncbi:MAG: hypothetical protein J2P37_25200, partial [Ktedonobacteraceae bacterium]|nr:hypothetical protein [Ktedonobacteraceae bacterium]
ATFVAPRLVGGSHAPSPIGGLGAKKMEQAWRLRNIQIRQFDDDILYEGDVSYSTATTWQYKGSVEGDSPEVFPELIG